MLVISKEANLTANYFISGLEKPTFVLLTFQFIKSNFSQGCTINLTFINYFCSNNIAAAVATARPDVTATSLFYYFSPWTSTSYYDCIFCLATDTDECCTTHTNFPFVVPLIHVQFITIIWKCWSYIGVIVSRYLTRRSLPIIANYLSNLSGHDYVYIWFLRMEWEKSDIHAAKPFLGMQR